MIAVSVFYFIKKRRERRFSNAQMFILIFLVFVFPLLFQSFPEFTIFTGLTIGATDLLIFGLLSLGGAELFALWLVIILAGIAFTHGGLSPGAIAHLAFALLFWLGFLRKQIQDRTEADLIAALLIFLDFFMFSILGEIFNNSLISNRLFIPIPFLFVAILTFDMKKDWLSKVLINIVIVGYIIYSFTLAINFVDISQQLDDTKNAQALEAAKVTWEKGKNFIKELFRGVNESITQTKATLRGDYYTANIDSQVKERELGLYLKDLKPFAKTYFDDEQVSVGGTLVVNAIDEEIIVHSLNCFSMVKNEEGDEKRIDGIMDPIINEQRPLSIFRKEQDSLSCDIPGTFPEPLWKEGTKTIVIQAKYDMVTSSYLRTVFLNREDFRQLTREEIDPYEHYGILKASGGIYTPGPLIIAPQLKADIVGLVIEEENELPYGFTLENDGTGSFTDFTSLFLILPKGMTLKKDEGASTSCFGYSFEPGSCSSLGSSFNDVDKWCADGDFNIYSLDVKNDQGKKLTDPLKGRELVDYRTVRCKVLAEPQRLLEDRPYAEHYTRIITKYTYQLEEKVTVPVRKTIEPEIAET